MGTTIKATAADVQAGDAVTIDGTNVMVDGITNRSDLTVLLHTRLGRTTKTEPWLLEADHAVTIYRP